MMHLLEKAAVLQYHRRRLGDPGRCALGWRTVDSQRLRFDALSRVGDLSGSKVLDLGCGYGDLKPFLDQRFADVAYLGIDHMPEFIEEARRRHGHLPRTGFVQADILNAVFPAVDYVLASGAMSYRCSNALYPYNLIRQMWDAAERGIAFNLLDARVFPPGSVLCGQDPEAILAFCRTLDPAAELVTGYVVDDFTVLMRRQTGIPAQA
ncbi:class I SAM-dependent methyltransferase [Dyella acidiphila]|uniref:Methyltransferase domain-containing protein n=1 Tax=Dyella acidiphila TaxID=2775866 RepID=A0ABR9G9F3_9GAMM|nr:class I SAM-dependent methyltransferase [Dyella acidiphila]MBE1160670.1 methyltransferase domain-containing protein [Dyella acidiphila]